MSEQVHIHILTAPWGIGSYRYINEEGQEEMGYGYYRPENPNDFFPDHECCRPEEISAHKAAADEYAKKQIVPIRSAPAKEGEK